MNMYTYNIPKDKSEAPHTVITASKRDSLGQYWMQTHTGQTWFHSHPHLCSTDYSTFYSHWMPLSDGRNLFQILTRTPTINGEDITKFTALAAKQGVDPATLITFGCGDLIPSDYLLA
uniref:uncharacterized protein LOC120343385 n=1 Tax=Styela clava TaxID=7725 RepID=UPI0019397655|nr:uncharacterized protein LOC120343385 [Styela clava]